MPATKRRKRTKAEARLRRLKGQAPLNRNTADGRPPVLSEVDEKALDMAQALIGDAHPDQGIIAAIRRDLSA